MVQLLSLIVLKHAGTGQAPFMLASAFALDNFGFFQRGSVKEVCIFVSREVVQRSALGQMMSVKHLTYMCHTRTTADGLCVAAVCDEDYPRYVAFTALKEVLDAFTKTFAEGWKVAQADKIMACPAIDQILTKYQNPTEADKVLKIQKELEETKQIVVKNIDQLLERGEKLDDLAAKSNDLSFQSKAFASRAEDMNRCCTIL